MKTCSIICHTNIPSVWECFSVRCEFWTNCNHVNWFRKGREIINFCHTCEMIVRCPCCDVETLVNWFYTEQNDIPKLFFILSCRCHHQFVQVAVWQTRGEKASHVWVGLLRLVSVGWISILKAATQTGFLPQQEHCNEWNQCTLHPQTSIDVKSNSFWVV